MRQLRSAALPRKKSSPSPSDGGERVEQENDSNYELEFVRHRSTDVEWRSYVSGGPRATTVVVNFIGHVVNIEAINQFSASIAEIQVGDRVSRIIERGLIRDRNRGGGITARSVTGGIRHIVNPHPRGKAFYHSIRELIVNVDAARLFGGGTEGDVIWVAIFKVSEVSGQGELFRQRSGDLILPAFCVAGRIEGWQRCRWRWHRIIGRIADAERALMNIIMINHDKDALVEELDLD